MLRNMPTMADAMALPGSVNDNPLPFSTSYDCSTLVVESVLDDIASDKGWGLESCEALVRTVVDLILFDRLKLLCRGSPINIFRIIDEYQIDTKTLDPNVTISGRCDYVLGYGGVPGKKDLDQVLVAIEVKKRYHLLPNSPQLIGYLGFPFSTPNGFIC